MAGTRRGPEGSGRQTRAELRPQERLDRLTERLANARNQRERVAWAAAHLRAVMADPAVTDELDRQTGDQAVGFLLKLADQLHDAATSSRRQT
jgi:predicted ABC-type transport system involved in lysophospholipase L1 biosynthesis ATPase subunit